jgi:glycosyltransferase involved in cell wall biosynthesis
MKIVIVNTFDIMGGAARAAYRQHRALIDAGVDSHMVVQQKYSDDPTVTGSTSRLGRFFHNVVGNPLDMMPLRQYSEKDRTYFSPAWVPSSGVVRRINALKPDIVHLHWIGGGMMRIEDIARINAPIVWSLHDMWAFTGGCHYDGECEKFQDRCGACPRLHSDTENDLSRKVFERKHKTCAQIDDLTIVGLSRWLMDCSQRSTLLGEYPHVNLSNPLDTTFYVPCDKEDARTQLNLPQDKKLILFGAMSATDDPRKGFRELTQALDTIEKKDVELVVFGSDGDGQNALCGLPVHYVGRIDDDATLVRLYSAADVMVVPSLQENLSNAIMESLSCATPAVAFDIGGNSDMIDHEENGYLPKPFDTDDLARGIEWVLDHPQYNDLCVNARKKVVENFDAKIVAEKYIALYREILHTK